MKKSIILLSLITTLFSCQNGQNKTNPKMSTRDSLEMEIRVQKELEKFNESRKWDTVGVKLSGVQIKKAIFFKEEYSNYKSVKLTYKNISGKKIKAIRFRWYGINAFNEPAESGSLTDSGFGGGFDDRSLGIGSTTSGVWSVLSDDGDKIVKAWPTEVIYSDGSKWESTYFMK